jgi:hypothetical protein
MGDNLLRQQIQNFKKRRDKARAEAGVPNLYHRPEIIETVYEATPTNGESFKPDDVLYVCCEDDHVVLAKGNKKVAVLCGDAGRALHESLNEPDTAGIAQVRIVSIMELSGGLLVQIIKERA